MRRSSRVGGGRDLAAVGGVAVAVGVGGVAGVPARPPPQVAVALADTLHTVAQAPQWARSELSETSQPSAGLPLQSAQPASQVPRAQTLAPHTPVAWA